MIQTARLADTFFTCFLLKNWSTDPLPLPLQRRGWGAGGRGPFNSPPSASNNENLPAVSPTDVRLSRNCPAIISKSPPQCLAKPRTRSLATVSRSRSTALAMHICAHAHAGISASTTKLMTSPDYPTDLSTTTLKSRRRGYSHLPSRLIVQLREKLYILESAEHVVFQNGGDRIMVNCPPGHTALRKAIHDRHPSTVSCTGATLTIDLIPPTQDGLNHEGHNARITLQRISCPTCVERIVESRTRARREAYETKATPQQISALTHLIAGAYDHLARTEESLWLPPPAYGDRAA